MRSRSKTSTPKLRKQRSERRRKNRDCLLHEPLENRRLLAITTPVLGGGSDIVFNGDAATDTVYFDVRSDGYLEHNLAGSFGFASSIDLDASTAGEQARRLSELTSLSYNDVGNNDNVAFNGATEIAFDAADVTVNAGIIRALSGVNISATSGAIQLTADTELVLAAGSSITTVDGGILLSANAHATAVGNFAGLRTYATIRSTGNGNIALTGTGGIDSTNDREGVEVLGGEISSTAGGPAAGTIMIAGTGSANTASGGTDSKRGVEIRNATITSVDGDILITGQGGSGAGYDYDGVAISLATIIESTGVGDDAATITIDGTTGMGLEGDGVVLGGNPTITSVDGDIVVTGHGTASGATGGININRANITSTGTGTGAATITIDGKGGDAQSLSHGIKLRGYDSAISSIVGDISIVGKGGVHQSLSRGLLVYDFAEIASLGVGPNAAKITLHGQAGNSGEGILFSSPSGITREITSVDGNIAITGDSTTGLAFYSDSGELRIRSTGAGADAADITITGTGASGGDFYLSGSTGGIETLDGDILISGDSLAAEIPIASTNSGNVTFETVAGVSLAQVSSLDGDITIRGDSLSLSPASELRSTGNLRILPADSTAAIGLGGGIGTLKLDDAELSRLADGFASITIGDPVAGSGVVDIATATFTDPVTIAGGAIHDRTGTDIDAGSNNVTLLGAVSPGQSPGVLTVAGNFSFADSDTFDVEIGGVTPGTTATSHDQLDVAGTVSIGAGVTLNTSGFGGFTPQEGQQFVIVNNDGTDPVSGTFAGLGEGALIADFLGSGLFARISYLGTDGATGNDVVLTVENPFVVTSTLDAIDPGDGVTTLREAITNANASAGLDTISFNIHGTGVHTIQPQSPLPSISDPVIIDGFTQTGALGKYAGHRQRCRAAN